MQSFYSCNNTLSNSHNQSTKKINDMSMSVRNEKILLVKKTIQMKSLQIIVTVLACVTRKMLGKEMLDHLDDVEQYYR